MINIGVWYWDRDSKEPDEVYTLEDFIKEFNKGNRNITDACKIEIIKEKDYE